MLNADLSPSEQQVLGLWMGFIDSGVLEQAEMLSEQRHAEYPESLQVEIFQHIFYRCQIDFLRYVIEICHFDANITFAGGQSAVHVAATYGWLEGVRYLVEKCRCDPNAKDSLGRIPLHAAIQTGDLAIVRYLIETCHCNPEAVANGDHAPLITASYAHLADLDIMEYLVEVCRVNVNACESHGYTALFYAANNGQDNKVKYLCEHGAKVNLKNGQGKSMLQSLRACYNELDASSGDGVTLEILNYLHSQGAVEHME